MAPKSKFLQAIRNSVEGRRFVLNLVYCIDNNILSPDPEFGTLLRNAHDHYISHYARRKPGDWGNALLDALTVHRRLWCSHHVVPEKVEDVSRIITATNLLWDKSHALISPTALTRAGLTRRHRRNRMFFERVERLNGHASAIRPGALLRGRQPLSWVLPRQALVECRAKHTGTHGRLPPQGSLTREIRDRAAIEFPHNEEPLFEMRYPARILNKVGHARPTAIEAVGNRFFRAWIGPAAIGPSGWGFTVNARSLALRDVPDHGIPELLVDEVPFSVQFSWAGIGILSAPAKPVDEDYLTRRIYPGQEPKRLLRRGMLALSRLMRPAL